MNSYSNSVEAVGASISKLNEARAIILSHNFDTNSIGAIQENFADLETKIAKIRKYIMEATVSLEESFYHSNEAKFAKFSTSSDFPIEDVKFRRDNIQVVLANEINKDDEAAIDNMCKYHERDEYDAAGMQRQYNNNMRSELSCNRKLRSETTSRPARIDNDPEKSSVSPAQPVTTRIRRPAADSDRASSNSLVGKFLSKRFREGLFFGIVIGLKRPYYQV